MSFSRQARIRGVVWGCVILLSAGVAVYAFNPQPEPPGHYFGLMTLEAGQHVSLNLANTKMAVDAFRPSDTCTARMDIVDACGARLAGRTVRIQPGASRTLNFTVPSELPPDPCFEGPEEIPGETSLVVDPGDSRMTLRLRAQVVFSGDAGHCVSSLEVGDPFIGGATGGGSGFINPGMIVGFNPQPDPPVPAPKIR